MSSKLMHVIGGGPVGCLAALHLARQGHRVQIYERRPDMRKTKIPAGRSINLALSQRGIYALQELGLEKTVLAQAIPMYGRSIHSINGDISFQRYGKDNSEYINSISRAELNKALLTEAEKANNVELFFDHKLSDYNLDTGELCFEVAGAQEKKVISKTSIGTDGSASVLRKVMQSKLAIESTEETLEYSYKELTIGPNSLGQHKMEKNALHIWPRGSFMLIALPNFDGSFTCTLFLKTLGEESFETLSNPLQVKAFFEKYFLDVCHLIDNLEESFFENPTGHMVTVRSGPWNYKDQLLLLGDAAHAIVPFFGQGLNCGFEDCTLLKKVLDQKGDLSFAFDQFYRQRKTDADAIATLALDNFVEMRDKVGQARFLLEKNIERVLAEKFPNIYVTRYALVTFSREPYSLALKVGRVQDEILSRLSSSITDVASLNLNLAKELIEKDLLPLMKERPGIK